LRDVYSLKSALLSNTATIKTLSLDKSLDHEESRYLLDGLRSNSSIRQFELRDRHLTPDATCNHTKFVQTNANRFGSHVFNRAVCRTVPLLHQELVVATMLNGSALEKLKLRGLLSPSESAFYLVTNDSNIRLQRLTLQGTAESGSNLRSLCQHLATTSTLQYLYFTLLDVKEDAQSLAEGLRQNGSLVRLRQRQTREYGYHEHFLYQEYLPSDDASCSE
jgi:hypothetical protein